MKAQVFAVLLPLLMTSACGVHSSHNSGFSAGGDTFRGGKGTKGDQMASAIEAGLEAEVSALLTDGFDLNGKLPNGRTPLIHAVVAQRIRILVLFLNQGADRQLKDDGGLTALDHARANDIKRALVLLDESAQQAARDELVKFVNRRSTPGVERQLRAGTDPNFVTVDGGTPLLLAIRQVPMFPGARLVVEMLARWRDPEGLTDTQLDLAGADGVTPLALARELGLNEIVRLLTELGAKE